MPIEDALSLLMWALLVSSLIRLSAIAGEDQGLPGAPAAEAGREQGAGLPIAVRRQHLLVNTRAFFKNEMCLN